MVGARDRRAREARRTASRFTRAVWADSSVGSWEAARSGHFQGNIGRQRYDLQFEPRGQSVGDCRDAVAHSDAEG